MLSLAFRTVTRPHAPNNSQLNKSFEREYRDLYRCTACSQLINFDHNNSVVAMHGTTLKAVCATENCV